MANFINPVPEKRLYSELLSNTNQISLRHSKIDAAEDKSYYGTYRISHLLNYVFS